MAKKKTTPTGGRTRAKPKPKAILCQSKYCGGFTTTTSRPNRTRLHYLIYAGPDGEPISTHSAYLCRYCAKATGDFFNGPFKM